MKRRWMRALGTTSIIVFIGLNIFFIEKENSRADRLNFVSNWTRVVAGDVIETTPVEGVITPAEKHPIFIDPHTEFSRFLVEKGARVESGTPLFEYASDNLEQQKTLLDTEISSLIASKNSIDAFIRSLEGIKYALPSPVTRSFFTAEEATDAASRADQEAISTRVLSVSIDQAIAEKELEKDKIDLDIKKYEDQRQTIESGRSGLTVLSSHAGIVEDISFALDNPVITIVSDTSVMEGRMTEEQMQVVEEGMKADITSNLFTGKIIGEINKLETLPIDRPEIDKESLYRFTAELGEHDEKLNIGYHVDAKIITAEAIDVPVFDKKSTFKDGEIMHVWMLNDQGFAEMRVINPGLKVGKRLEVKSGVKLEDFYVLDQQEVHSQAPFITPFKVNKLKKTAWSETRFKKILKYVLIGVLQR
ncbi:efflux RND transporter periplasmic adaptor subunit [Bacillus sp. FSL K6-3431]|uniref:efflux RND transporter periplasmic adaptor subunit n=1 Tax=Bacillus sp. FSL K6-3431 TaxID=2921500 RepID=UPI0030FB2C61